MVTKAARLREEKVLPNHRVRGIVEVMEHSRHEERAQSLSDALGRLSTQRAERGPVGLLDPYEIARRAEGTVPEHESESRAATGVPEMHADESQTRRRAGLFTFSDRARAAADRFRSR